MAFRQTDAWVAKQAFVGRLTYACLVPLFPAGTWLGAIGLAARSASLYQWPVFRPFCRCKNQFVTRFDTVLRRFALILILLVAGLAAPAFAQSADQPATTDGIVTKQRTVVDGLKKQLDDIQSK